MASIFNVHLLLWKVRRYGDEIHSRVSSQIKSCGIVDVMVWHMNMVSFIEITSYGNLVYCQFSLGLINALTPDLRINVDRIKSLDNFVLSGIFKIVVNTSHKNLPIYIPTLCTWYYSKFCVCCFQTVYRLVMPKSDYFRRCYGTIDENQKSRLLYRHVSWTVQI